jgi:YHS domain-containing protein
MGDGLQSPILDPVCGMKVDPSSGDLKFTYNEEDYYFCDEECRRAFEKHPDRYLKPKGLLGRFMEWLAKGNKQAFGGGKPSCCR